ncbi:hypothetical protein F5148DRAFT_978626 [Russula earlei]|uniref:Uncharacterized protein n=1 Tax=Russula earlei TaxID=71964 RepID=A0ACC0UBW3_9AGAM|nr:hypothetical protein F5148DRAFT_978626 [Russula earlei]
MSDQSFLGVSTTTTDASHDHGPTTPSTPTSPLMKPTRTVAIIKPHAVDHRFEIEHRITEAKFEIVKERQMEFDMETDPDALFELFGDDARSFAEGPVWVYVLERRRAIEVWNTIMGDVDPHHARQLTPTSLRALYGITREHNAVMGSPDPDTAEIQINSLFLSSPPFPSSDLPSDLSADADARVLTTASLRSLSSSLRSSARLAQQRSASSSNGHSPARTSSSHPPRRTPFRARDIPPSHASPTIVPRTTRAASLRAGATPPNLDRARSAPRTPPSKEALRKIFADVPGHKRTASIQVASTAAPTVPPRMTRAAALRISGATPPTPVVPKPIITIAQAKAKAAEEERAKAALQEAQARTFEGVPGHKRRESISVSSTAKAPTITPRQNRSALLRASKDATPPSSYQCASVCLSVSLSPVSLFCFRLVEQRFLRPPIGPSLSRSTSSDSYGSPGRPSTAQGDVHSPRRSFSRMSDIGPGAIGTPPRERPISLQAPTMVPRQNRSAMLRAAKIANGA